jgi:FkbM family methyltransferase
LERKFLGSSIKPFRFALGEHEQISQMYVASNGAQSSSLSRPTSHLTLHPEINFQSIEEVAVVTLDHFMKEERITSESIYLKVDAQGAEWSVIQGAISTLERVSVIEIESCMTPEFEKEVSHHKLVSFLLDREFIYLTGEPPRVDSTGRQWDLNSILCKNPVADIFRK